MSDPGDPPGEIPDMAGLLEQAQQLSQQLFADAGDETYEGVAGGGLVRVIVGATGEFEKVTISPDAVDPADVELLEDLVLAAVRDAATRAQAGVQKRLGGALGGLFGGGPD
jgi:nucleoid-associated protein EbfC